MWLEIQNNKIIKWIQSHIVRTTMAQKGHSKEDFSISKVEISKLAI